MGVQCVNGATPVWGQDFTYGGMYDNLSKTVPTGQTGVTWAPTYNPANNTYSQATYDANGSILTDTFHTYTWNQDNKVKGITDAGVSGILYDAFGRKVEWKKGSTYSQTLMSPFGPVALMSQGTTTQYRVPLPGGDTAVNGVNFEHKDNLGNVPFVSSRSRTSTASRLFAPYGESYNNVGITGDLDFTGDRQDLVAGVYDTPNRELTPNAGRWATPDPVGSSWNAYAYSTNPMSEIDPSGLSSCWGGTARNGSSCLGGWRNFYWGNRGGEPQYFTNVSDTNGWGGPGWIAAAGFVSPFDSASDFVVTSYSTTTTTSTSFSVGGKGPSFPICESDCDTGYTFQVTVVDKTQTLIQGDAFQLTGMTQEQYQRGLWEGVVIGEALGVFGRTALEVGRTALSNMGKTLGRLWADEAGTLRIIHNTPPLEGSGSYQFWNKKSTQEIIDSLVPNAERPLRVYPDGGIADGNTRITILQERGVDVNSLPYVTRIPDPIPEP